MKLNTDFIQTVAEYAGERGCTTSYIYKLVKQVKEGKKTSSDIGFRIIKVRGKNFITKN